MTRVMARAAAGTAHIAVGTAGIARRDREIPAGASPNPGRSAGCGTSASLPVPAPGTIRLLGVRIVDTPRTTPSSSRPIVNVVAVFLVLLSLLPLYLAQRLTRDGSAAGGRV
jgi:hypothetical protein